MKKILITILTISTMVVAFAGCGSSQEPQETTAAPTEAATQATTQATTQAATQAPAGDIGVEKAKEIALNDAGISAENAQFVKAAPEIDDGINIYDLEFTSGEMKYDYDIDAASGNILSKDMESIYDD